MQRKTDLTSYQDLPQELKQHILSYSFPHGVISTQWQKFFQLKEVSKQFHHNILQITTSPQFAIDIISKIIPTPFALKFIIYFRSTEEYKKLTAIPREKMTPIEIICHAMTTDKIDDIKIEELEKAKTKIKDEDILFYVNVMLQGFQIGLEFFLNKGKLYAGLTHLNPLRRYLFKKFVNLEAANLSGFSGHNLNLTQMEMKKVCLMGANLAGADLTEADLREANLNGAFLVGANLTNANLAGADLSVATLRKANLQGVNLQGASLELTQFFFTMNNEDKGWELEFREGLNHFNEMLQDHLYENELRQAIVRDIINIISGLLYSKPDTAHETGIKLIRMIINHPFFACENVRKAKVLVNNIFSLFHLAQPKTFFSGVNTLKTFEAKLLESLKEKNQVIQKRG